MSHDHDSASEFFDPSSGTHPSPGAMLDVDPLSDVLRAIRLTAATFFLIDATDPYCVDIPHTDHYRDLLQPSARHMISFHVILEGGGVAAVPGSPPRPYQEGDIVVFPLGDGYRMGTAADTPPEFDYDQTMAFFQGLATGTLPFVIPEGGGNPPPTRVICGFLGCDAGPFNPMISSLPPLLVIKPGPRKNLLSHLIDLTLAEAGNTDVGGASVRLGLAELMFVEAIRRHIGSGQYQSGWLAGLGDPIVSRALALLHAEPARSWTLQILSSETGTSRTILADRFKRFLGYGPIRYLTQWRMQLAARRLVESQDSVATIAIGVGYQSEASFSRAFKRVANFSPSEWRRRPETASQKAGKTTPSNC